MVKLLRFVLRFFVLLCCYCCSESHKKFHEALLVLIVLHLFRILSRNSFLSLVINRKVLQTNFNSLVLFFFFFLKNFWEKISLQKQKSFPWLEDTVEANFLTGRITLKIWVG